MGAKTFEGGDNHEDGRIHISEGDRESMLTPSSNQRAFDQIECRWR
jgi:hypothetical protein